MWREVARASMSRRLIWRPCPEDGCNATRGEWCDDSAAPQSEMIRIDSGHLVHAGRMLAAVGLIPRRQLIAQFDGPLPAGLAA